MSTDLTSSPANAGSGHPGSGDAPPAATRRRRPSWLLVAVAVVVSLIVGGSVQHAFDDRSATRALYRAQVLTAESRFFDAENSQVALPVARRSITAFGSLADSISGDGGVNGDGTLSVSMDTGSVLQPTQIDVSFTVASPYASTTIALWSILVSDQSDTSSDQGACVLSSTLLGPGRATTDLQLGGGYYVLPCSPRWWSSGSIWAPHLGTAGISQPPR
jgi:hypothetical protein